MDEDRGMTPEEVALGGWRFVIDPMTGKFPPDFDPEKTYQFRLRWEDEIHSYRMADQNPLMNAWGLFWREPSDEKGSAPMFTGLTDDDFPLRTVGARVYTAKQPTCILTACDDIMAEDVVRRLNDAQGFTAIERME